MAKNEQERRNPNNPGKQSNRQKNQQNTAANTAENKDDAALKRMEQKFFTEKLAQVPDAFCVYFPNNSSSSACEQLTKEFELFLQKNAPFLESNYRRYQNTPEKKANIKAGLIERFRQASLLHYTEKKQWSDLVEKTAQNNAKSWSNKQSELLQKALAPMDISAIKNILRSDKSLYQFLRRENIEFIKKESLNVEKTLASLDEEQKITIGEQFRLVLEAKNTTLPHVVSFLKHLPPKVQLELIRTYHKPIPLSAFPHKELDEEAIMTHMVAKNGLKRENILPQDWQLLKKQLADTPLTVEDLLSGQSLEEAVIQNTPELQDFLCALVGAEKVAQAVDAIQNHNAFLAKLTKECPLLKNPQYLNHKGAVIKIQDTNIGYAQWFKLKGINISKNGKQGVLLNNITAPAGGVYLDGKDEFVAYEDLLDLLSGDGDGENCILESSANFQRQLNVGALRQVVDPENIDTKEELQNLLDSSTIDSKGKKHGLKVGTCFSFTGAKNSGGIAKITHIDKTIRISNANGDNKFTFLEFYNSFVSAQAQRIAIINDPTDVLKTLQNHANQKVKNGFGKIAFKDGAFIDKQTQGNAKPVVVQYFINKQSGKGVHIESFNDGMVKCKTGKWSQGKNQGSDTFSTSPTSEWVPLENLYWFISQNELEPEVIKNPDALAAEINNTENTFTNSLFNRWLNGMSYLSLIKGGKHIIKAIEAQMKEGTDLNAARFARSLGRFLPLEMASQLDSVVGSEEKKLRDAFSGRLKKLDQAYAILGDKSAQDYKIEAALLFVMKENGTLYPEKEFKGIRGQFKWYERF